LWSKPHYVEIEYLIQILQKKDLQYGYMSYWYAPLTTFLSGNAIRSRQIQCISHHVRAHQWLAANDWYHHSASGKKTFLLIDLNGNLTPELNGCSNDNLISQFGQPTETIPVSFHDDHLTLLIFNYNIGDKL